MPVAIAHDYLTQAGGAERVVAALVEAFPGAPLFTSLFDLEHTFPEFGSVDVRPGPLNRVGVLRRNHRLALPLLAPAVSHTMIDADVVVCSSSGWAHGMRTSGSKIVYCHTPARWLWVKEDYQLSGAMSAGVLAARALGPALRRWDRRAAATADRYLANSSVVQERIRRVYGIDAEVVPPPRGLDPAGRAEPVEGIEPGFVLCVARLMPYKHVDVVIEAIRRLGDLRLVVVGTGPQADELRAAAGPGTTLLGRVSDPQLHWLYRNCSMVVSASHEDFGITPVEGFSFGKPAVTLRAGGFLDSVVEDETGVFFDAPDPTAVAAAIARATATTWDEQRIRDHGARYDPATFIGSMRAIVGEVSRGGTS